MRVSLRFLALTFLATLTSRSASGVDEKTAPRLAPVITLEEAYDRTLASDQSIQVAWHELRKADLEPWSALTALGPSLNLNSSSATNRSSSTADGFTTSTKTDTSTAGLVFQQPILDLTVIPAYRLGKLTAKAARLTYQSTIRQVLYGVTTAYYNVLKQQRVVAINGETVALAEQQLDLAQKRVNAGEVKRTDVLNARVTLENDRQALIASENTLLSQRNVLANILNVAPETATAFQVTEPRAYPSALPEFKALLTQAYQQREDLRVKGIAIGQNIESRSVVVAGYGPKLSAQWDNDYNRFSGASTSRSNEWNAAISVSMPIFTGGQREIDLNKAGHNIGEARLNYASYLKTVQQDVKDAWLEVRTLEETLKASDIQVEAAKQSYEDTQNQYRAGEATSLDVLTSLNALNVSLKNLAMQQYGYQVALRNLEQTSGIFQESRIQKLKFK